MPASEPQRQRPRERSAVVPLRPRRRRSATVTLPGGAESVAMARASVAGLLIGWNQDSLDTAILLTSEVVTNAVVHGESDIEIAVTADARSVRISVSDGSTRHPIIRSPNLDAMGGRGVFLLDQLANEWGVSDRGDGKTVWFVVRS